MPGQPPKLGVPTQHDLRELYREAREQGWSVRRTQSGHLIWTKRGRKPVTSGDTISSRSVTTLRARLKLSRNEGKPKRARTPSDDVSGLPGEGDFRPVSEGPGARQEAGHDDPGRGADEPDRPDRAREWETLHPTGGGGDEGLHPASRDLPGSAELEGPDQEEPAVLTEPKLIRDRVPAEPTTRATAEEMTYYLAIKLQEEADGAATAALDMDPDALAEELADVWEVLLTLADALVPGGHFTVDRLRRQKRIDVGGFETGRLYDVPINNQRETP